MRCYSRSHLDDRHGDERRPEGVQGVALQKVLVGPVYGSRGPCTGIAGMSILDSELLAVSTSAKDGIKFVSANSGTVSR